MVELADYLLPFLDVDSPIVIRMRHEPHEAAARLLVSLGAGWIVDEEAPPCVRRCSRPECDVSALPAGYEQGVDGPVEMHRWCPECSDLVVAHDHKTECLWCGAQTVPATEATTERSTTMSTVATTTCKHCTNEIADKRGIYAGLCSHHKQLARTARANGHVGGGNASRSPSDSDSYAARVRDLLPAARALDRAMAKLADAGSNEKLRAAFQEASRNATASPNEANLERLEAATKALRKGAPKRQQAQTAHDGAERTFKLELGAIARDFRA